MRSVVEIGANVPAFLGKLWKLVDDPDTDHLISWSPGGKMFSIQNQADFARELLPLYYKHNNMASFIRQLNMYGFHKVTSVENGGLKSEKDEIEFSHPCFLRGHPYLLEHIKRKIANPKPTVTNMGEDKALRPDIMSKVLVDVKQMKGKQESLDARFSVMKHENEALWREVALLRQKHIKQQQIVNNLIQFLMSLVQPSRSGPLKTGVKRRYQLMINNAAHNSTSSDRGRDSKSPRLETDPDFELDDLDNLEDMENGPTIHEVAEQEQLSEASGRSILLCAERDAQVSASPSTTYSYMAPSPAFSASSLGHETISAEDVDDPDIQTVPIDFNPNILSEEVVCMPELLEDVSVNEKGRKSNKPLRTTPNTIVENNSPSMSVPACSILSSTQPDPTLPSNIFDTDETNSQDEGAVSMSDVDQQAALSALQQVTDPFYEEPAVTSPDTDYLNTVTSGNYNPNLNLNTTAKIKKGKTNMNKDDQLLKTIKEEILCPEEEDWSNMTLATVPVADQARAPLNRLQSVTLMDFTPQCQERKSKKFPGPPYPKEEVDDHLEAMQTDLENIKQLLRGDNYTFDANTLLGLFGQDESLYNLPPMNPADLTLDKVKEGIDDPSSQLISYVPPASSLFDFGDIQLEGSPTEDWPGADKDIAPSPIIENSSTLNTPQVQMSAPDFSPQ